MIETFRTLHRDLRGMGINPSSVMVTLRFANEDERWKAAWSIGAQLNALRRVPEAQSPVIYTGTILDIPFELVTQ